MPLRTRRPSRPGEPDAPARLSPVTLDRAGLDRLIRRHLKQLQRPGVLTVRPGWEIASRQVSGRPAIVVTVERKKTRLAAAARLPDEIEGVPVDVREASPMARLRLADPAAHELLKDRARGVPRDREDPLERRVVDGTRVSAIGARAAGAARGTAAALAAARTARKPQLTYTGARRPLKAVKTTATILACASPDAGFTVLADFLAATKQRLTVGLYDFTSARLLQVMTTLLRRKSPQFSLVLDHPGVNPTANQTDDDTVAALRKAEHGVRIAHALTRGDPWASAWLFLDYHIKVAVRDSSSFWLSSGNWNPSNQPDFATHDPNDGMYSDADRDWHVVIAHKGLAELFETYIAHDHQVADAHQVAPDPATERAVAQAQATLRKIVDKRKDAKETTPRVPFTLGAPRTFRVTNAIVQPLLTPDRGRRTTMYVENVLTMLTSARKTLYIQMQYFEPSEQPGDRDFMRLLEAVRDAANRHVDVRLIGSGNFASKWLEPMHELGLTPVLRLQDNVHNKGIVVDGKQVLVSSQNWSAAGTLRNRDAGVIIHHPGIAQFFEANFVEDWERRARPAGPGAPAGTRAPAGEHDTSRTKARPSRGPSRRPSRR